MAPSIATTAASRALTATHTSLMCSCDTCRLQKTALLVRVHSYTTNARTSGRRRHCQFPPAAAWSPLERPPPQLRPLCPHRPATVPGRQRLSLDGRRPAWEGAGRAEPCIGSGTAGMHDRLPSAPLEHKRRSTSRSASPAEQRASPSHTAFSPPVLTSPRVHASETEHRTAGACPQSGA